MAKWKEPTTKVATTEVDPRARMKEIRAEVKAFLKGDTLNLAHLGDLPNTMEDARRVIIATQDLLEIERDKHRKATDHIAELVHMLGHMADTHLELMKIIDQQGRQIYGLNQRMEADEKDSYHMSNEMRQSQQERDAVLLTMKLLNGQQPQSAPMSVTLGYSNKDRGRWDKSSLEHWPLLVWCCSSS